MAGYHSHTALGNDLAALRSSHPGIVDASVTDIGNSVEGRSIWAIKIGKNPSVKVLFVGCHHAREWISVEVPFLLAKHLVENYASDARIQRLVDSREIWIVPMLNPDGLEFSRSSAANRLWRKNRRDNSDGTFGVDLNRNYPHSSWGTNIGFLKPQSRLTGSDGYIGSSAGSEVEVKAIVNLMTRQRFKAAVSYHSYAQLILYPWSFTQTPISDPTYVGFIQGLAEEMSRLILARHGEHYTVAQSSNDAGILYCIPDDEVTGSFLDWAFDSSHIPVLTIELRPLAEDLGGFLLPPSQITPIFEEQLPAALEFIECADSLARSRTTVTQPGTTVRTALTACRITPPPGTSSGATSNIVVNRVNGRELIGIVFDTDRSFLKPSAKDDLLAAERAINADSEIQPFLVGHTDLIGPASDNEPLSECRARSTFAYLTNDVAVWQSLRRTENWGLREAQYMLQYLDYYRGFVDNKTGSLTRQAIEKFQRDFCLRETGRLDDDTWNTLLEIYMFRNNAVVFPDRFERHRWRGCGERHPLINEVRALQQNRRVEVLFYRGDPQPPRSVCSCDFYPALRPTPPSGTITVEGRMERNTDFPATNFVAYASQQIRVYDPKGSLHKLTTDANGRWRLSNVPAGLYVIEVKGGVDSTLKLSLVGQTTLRASYNGRISADLRSDPSQLHIRVVDESLGFVIRTDIPTRLTPVTIGQVSSAERNLITHLQASKQPPVNFIIDILKQSDVRVVIIGEHHHSEITRKMTADVVRQARADPTIQLSGVVFEIDKSRENDIAQGRYERLPGNLSQPEAKRLITLVRRDDSLDFVAMDDTSLSSSDRNRSMADNIAAHVNSHPNTKTLVLVGGDHAKEVGDKAGRFLSDQPGTGAVYSITVESGVQGSQSNEEIRIYSLLRRQFTDNSFGFDIDSSPLNSFTFDSGDTETWRQVPRAPTDFINTLSGNNAAYNYAANATSTNPRADLMFGSNLFTVADDGATANVTDQTAVSVTADSFAVQAGAAPAERILFTCHQPGERVSITVAAGTTPGTCTVTMTAIDSDLFNPATGRPFTFGDVFDGYVFFRYHRRCTNLSI
jgi:carboxypeptidase T